MDKIESSKYYDYDQFDSESSDVESTEESSIEESNKIKSFRSYNESAARRIDSPQPEVDWE